MKQEKPKEIDFLACYLFGYLKRCTSLLSNTLIGKGMIQVHDKVFQPR